MARSRLLLLALLVMAGGCKSKTTSGDLSASAASAKHGARAVRQTIIDNPKTKALTTFVVWIPMLDGDELPGAAEASKRFSDLPIPQFWDGAQILGKEVGRSIGAPTRTAWDIYLFYSPGAEWTDQGLPAPEHVLAQVAGAVVGTKGTLRAVGDQSRLPEKMRARVDVVGEQSDLEELLARVAEPFAKRYSNNAGPPSRP
jgi:hypothetical protein